MTARAVHWHEGMFLRPHHLQAAQRHQAQQRSHGDKWDFHYNWGLRSVDLDVNALANHRFVVRTLQARLRDGTLVSVPDDGLLPILDLRAAFDKENTVTVYLAVPVLHSGRANVAGGTSGDGARYLVDAQEFEDENTGVNPQSLQVRLLNLKLLVSSQDHTGYETLPIARIGKSAGADAAPQLDESYIPPLLACDAWRVLRARILDPVYDRIGAKIDLHANQVVSRGITFDSQAQGDPKIFSELRVLNEAYSFFGVQMFADGVHPLHSYQELARLIGQLAILGDTRRPPELPKYDHDDLGKCFYAAKKYLDLLLGLVDEPLYKERPFIGAGLRMQVNLEPIWLEPIWQMFVGVKSPLSADDTIRLLTRAGELDMKIGSTDRVDEIYRRGERGLLFAPSARPPRALPQIAGLVYFQVNRESQQAEWQSVQRSFALGIRMNETLIVGDIDKQRVIKIRHRSQTVEMQFTLYLVPGEKK